MLTITIIFALLVALWGFPGAIAMLAKHASSRARPAPADDSVSHPRAARPAASAGR